MSSDLVLITGGTGHIGFKVLVDTLEAGFNVRAAIRDSSREDIILSAKPIKMINPGSRLTFVVVPDITSEGAYDQAVQGVKYIIHIASPLAGVASSPDEFQSKVITPAVKGTVGILASAQRTTGIERVVITGSSASIFPMSAVLLGKSDETFDESAVPEPLPQTIDNPLVAYCVSKIAAYNATKDFIEKEHPSFDVVTLMPSFVIGADRLVTEATGIMKGTNSYALGQILGRSVDYSLAGTTVHLDDVSRAHVLALNTKIPGNTQYILNSGGKEGTTWSDALEIVARNYPEAVAAGVFPNDGVMKTHRARVDASKVEKVFGFKHQDYEAQVKSVVDYYLELSGTK